MKPATIPPRQGDPDSNAVARALAAPLADEFLHLDPDSTAAGRKNMQQLIQLRWLAVLGQVATIAIAYLLFDIALPIDVMLALVIALATFNAASTLRLQVHHRVTNTELMVALLVDVGILTAQLYCSGGISNPFVFLYLLQVTLAAVLLRPWSTWLIVAVACLCVAGLALAGRTLALPMDHERGLASHYVQGVLLCFALNAALLVIFMTRISRNLRARDSRLAAMRQQAAEEEHIVRMGLLASGAAHELGTPLSTMAVILGDWQRMPPFLRDPELKQEITEMQTQVLRCKDIVTGILLSAGETRGDSPTETTVHRFLDQLVTQWRASRPPTHLDYDNQFGADLRILSDSALQQMICNVLDNAQEASPGWLRLAVTRQGDSLVLAISDAGPGFDPAILARLGKPYQSSKGRPGGGLGLFLSINVARTLGGSITARNLPGRGAVVTLTLPLAALSLGEHAHDAAAPDSANNGAAVHTPERGKEET